MLLRGEDMRYEQLPYERIRNLRIDNDLTQAQMAKMFGVKQNTYSQYEIGTIKYPVDLVIKLAKFYGTSVDYLLDLTDETNPYEKNSFS